MHVRSILTGILPLLLGGVLGSACDSGKDAAAKTDDKKADEVKADEVKADEVEADAVEADAAAAAEAAAAADAAHAAAAADAAAADADADDDDADDADDAADAADAKKADPKKPDAKKADPKKADAKKADPKKPDAKPEPAASKVDAKQLYSTKCKSCHGSTGKADTKLGEKHEIEDWTVAGWKAKWPVPKIENIIANGKAGTKMKAFKDKLSPEEIAAVAKYSHSLGK